MKAYTKHQERRRQDLISSAYFSAHFNRVKKLEKLEKYLEQPKQKKEMTDDEMLNMVKKLNVIFGGEEVNGKS